MKSSLYELLGDQSMRHTHVTMRLPNPWVQEDEETPNPGYVDVTFSSNKKDVILGFLHHQEDVAKVKGSHEALRALMQIQPPVDMQEVHLVSVCLAADYVADLSGFVERQEDKVELGLQAFCRMFWL
eukprot:4389437-Amphidinium_carterae.2